MPLTGTLAALALRYTLGVSVEASVGAVERHLADHSQPLPRALVRANERAWQAVGLAVAGDGLLDRARGWAAGGDVTALRDQLRAFLAAAPTGLEASPADLRARAGDELNRLRRAGRLALTLDGVEIAQDTRRYYAASDLVAGATAAVAAAAAALAADAPHLAGVLRLAPPGGPPLLAGAFLYFFRREVEADEGLARGLAFDALRALAAAQDRGFALLDDRTVGLLDQCDALFDAVADGFAGVSAELAAGFAGVSAANAKLDAIHRRLLKPGVTYATDDERTYLQRAKAEYRRNAGRVGAAEWALLGDAMSAARLYPDAGDAHEAAAAAARAARDATAEADNHHKAYLDACDAGAWPQAFDSLVKAVELDPARFRPFDTHRYKPLCILGGGAFGTVFHCHDEYDCDDDGRPREVAIKAFRADALDRDLTKVFAEARTLKTLGHTNIIGIHDHGFADPVARVRPYLVLEYFPGRTLDAHVAEFGPLPVPDLVDVARQVAGAVHAAHSRPRPIYHRDLKPANVMARRHPDGTWAVKVIDFGLAVSVAVAQAGASVPPASRSTREKSVTGTQKYAPPEQLGELPGVAVGPHSDVYAFGKTCLDVLFRTVAPKSWDWAALPAAYRGPLQELFERCTADALEHRHPNFEPVLAALAALDATAERPNPEAAGSVQVMGDRGGPQVMNAREGSEFERAETARGRGGEGDATRERSVATETRNDRSALKEARASRIAERLDPLRARPAGERLVLNLPGDLQLRFAWCPAGSFLMGSGKGGSRLGSASGAGNNAKLRVELPPGTTPTDLFRAIVVHRANGDHDAADALLEHLPQVDQSVEDSDEAPVHRVTLTKGFYFGVFPVTQSQWAAVIGTDPSRFKGSNRPVETVAWNECREFCARVTKLLKGRVNLRLPTEAEWEYACRAGTVSEYHFGDIIGETAANYGGRGSWNGSTAETHHQGTTDVGSFAANSWGLYDVHGNVDEWCADWFGPYAAADQTDPRCRSAGRWRVVRGGGWNAGPEACRSASRNGVPPESRKVHVGFRVCFDLSGAPDFFPANGSVERRVRPADQEAGGSGETRTTDPAGRPPNPTSRDPFAATRPALQAAGYEDVPAEIGRAWEEAISALDGEGAGAWEARWEALRQRAGAELTARLLAALLADEANGRVIRSLPVPARQRLRQAVADVREVPPPELCFPVDLAELELLFGGHPYVAWAAASGVLSPDAAGDIGAVPRPARARMRARALDYLRTAPRVHVSAYVTAACNSLDAHPDFLDVVFDPLTPAAADLMDTLLGFDSLRPGDWLKVWTAVLTHGEWGRYLVGESRLANLLVALGGDRAAREVWEDVLGHLTPALLSPDLVTDDECDPAEVHRWARQVHTHLRAAAERLVAVGISLEAALPAGGVARLTAANDLLRWLDEPADASTGPTGFRRACAALGVSAPALAVIKAVSRTHGFCRLDPVADASRLAPLVGLVRICFPLDRTPASAIRVASAARELSQGWPVASRGALQVLLLRECVPAVHYRALREADWQQPLAPAAIAWLGE